MVVPVSIEVAPDGSAIAFAFDYPSACGWGESEPGALDRLRDDLRFTRDWLDSHGLEPLPPRRPELQVEERMKATGDPLDCDSEGFFAIDRESYRNGDVERTRELLERSRTDLLNVVDVPDPVLDYRLVEGRRTVREVVEHVAIAEWWYMTRVETPYPVPENWREYPDETAELLQSVREDTWGFLETLTELPPATRPESRVLRGERWTLRKVLRRFVWHELLHYKQLCRLVPRVRRATGN